MELLKTDLKKGCLIALLLLVGLFSPATAQTDEAAQLLLNVEKLAQLKQILSDLEKGYQVVSSGYTTIKDISEGNFKLHHAFLDGLWKISPAVRDYYKVAGIVDYQLQLVREYRQAQRKFQQSGYFEPGELQYMAGVYDNLFRQSLRNLDELTIIMTAGTLRMSDEERMQAIDVIHGDMEDKVQFLRHFNNSTTGLAIQRKLEQQDLGRSRELYGITN